MNKSVRNLFTSLIAVTAFALCGANSFADCRGVMDADGNMWARIKIVNNSSSALSFAISNCKTAVESTDTTAVTDFSGGPGPTVDGGATAYVWVYGNVVVTNDDTGETTVSDMKVNVATADGGGFSQEHVPVEGSDGEWVVTVAADGSVSSSLASGANYGVPAH